MNKYIIIAGSDYSGKTTLYHQLDHLKEMPYICIDDITKEIGSLSSPADKMKALKISVDQIETLLHNHTSFVQETNLCGLGIVENLLKAKSQDYILEMYYVGIDSSDIVLNRISDDRIQSSIEKRYQESIKKLHDLIPLVDHVYIYDNSDSLCLISKYSHGKLVQQTNEIPEWFL